jgi:tRNA (guanine37-N1)-methyltransferase
MRIDVLTLFPEMFESPLGHSIPKRAQQQNIVEIVLSNIRDFAADNYRKVDDKPYGGGPGMVMMTAPVFACFEYVCSLDPRPGKVILLTPQGTPLTQEKLVEMSVLDRLILVAGRYEGFDERIRTGLDAEEISIGDYVLSGGELPAMVLIDALVRLLPGALGDDTSAIDESFRDGLLEYPQYTRPEEFRQLCVPEILLGGNHAEIEKWRHQQRIERTKQRRPDLWQKYLMKMNRQKDNAQNKKTGD